MRKMVIEATRKAKLIWRCRRGMLELDLMLSSFAKQSLHGLNEKQIDAFEALLQCTDPELLAWLLEQQKPQNKELAEIVQFIVLHHSALS